jgi:hypothetical protein
MALNCFHIHRLDLRSTRRKWETLNLYSVCTVDLPFWFFALLTVLKINNFGVFNLLHGFDCRRVHQPV